MPVYEYRCEECDHEFEVALSITAKQNGFRPECPECGGSRARQLLRSAPAAIRAGAEPGGGRPGPVLGCGPGCGCRIP